MKIAFRWLCEKKNNGSDENIQINSIFVNLLKVFFVLLPDVQFWLQLSPMYEKRREFLMKI